MTLSDVAIERPVFITMVSVAIVVLGIEPEEMVDPYDPTAFVTGLLFANEGVPHLTMIPVTTELIPEPNALALGILVVLIVGAQRKRN